jgi:hypothetical protein
MPQWNWTSNGSFAHPPDHRFSTAVSRHTGVTRSVVRCVASDLLLIIVKVPKFANDHFLFL